MDRTGRPEQVQAPALRSIIRMIDMAIENGSLDPQDRDEVIQMFISGPTTVVDNKAGGGMMNIDEMIRPIGMAGGGLMDQVLDLDTLVKIVKLEGALPNKDTDNLRKMSPIEIEILYNDTFGEGN